MPQRERPEEDQRLAVPHTHRAGVRDVEEVIYDEYV
jgi:hypothetical protein